MRGFVLLLVAMLATTAFWLFAYPGSDGAPDHGDPTPQAGAGESTPIAHGSNPAVRVPGAATAAPTRLEVRVGRDPEDVPFADVEVAAAALDGSEYRAIAATDTEGVASFDVPADATRATDLRRLRLSVAGGPTQTVRLAPGTPLRVDLRATARLFLQGQVVSAGGLPVDRAEIVLLPNVERVGDQPRVLRIGHTQRDGTFRLPVFGHGHVGARHDTLAPSTMVDIRTLPRQPDTGAAVVRLVLVSARCAAAGIVERPDGTPAADAELLLRPVPSATGSARQRPHPVSLRTDSNGRFATDDLPPGRVTYEALARDLHCARGAFASTVGGTTGIRIVLGAPGTVRGTVRSNDGDGVPAFVQYGQPGDLLWNRANTAEDGTYVLAGLPAGTGELIAREIRVAAVGAARRHATRAVDLAVAETVTWNVVFEPRGGGRRLHGLVVDQQQQPLRGSSVLVHRHDPPGDVRVTTGEDGRFSVACESGGLFDVFVYAPGRAFAGFPCVAHRDIDADHGMLLVEIDTQRRPAAIHGVVQSKTGDELPAQITCWHRENQQTVRLAAGIDGYFRLADIPPGTVILFFTLPGFVGPPREVQLASGERRDLGAITLERGSAVHGQVTTADGSAPAVVEISIHTESERLVADYNAGSYRFDSVPPGHHRLLIHGTGIAASAHPIEILAGVEVVQDITVVPGIERRIHVVDPHGDGGWVTLALREPEQPYTSMLGQRLPTEGRIEFMAYMAPGTYEAVAWDEKGRQGRANVTFAAGAAAPTPIELKGR